MDLFQILQKFPDEKSCYDYFEKIRWKGNIMCPHCNSKHEGKRYEDFRYHCSKCRNRFSAISSTYLHNTRMPLQKWILAFAVVSDAKKGLSSKQLERNLGVHYETAFNMAHLFPLG